MSFWTTFRFSPRPLADVVGRTGSPAEQIEDFLLGWKPIRRASLACLGKIGDDLEQNRQAVVRFRSVFPELTRAAFGVRDGTNGGIELNLVRAYPERFVLLFSGSIPGRY